MDKKYTQQIFYFIHFIYAKPIQKCCVKVKSSFYILIKTFFFFFWLRTVWEEWGFDCFIYRNPLSLFKNIDIGIRSFSFSLKANCCTVYNSSKCPNNQKYPMTTIQAFCAQLKSIRILMSCLHPVLVFCGLFYFNVYSSKIILLCNIQYFLKEVMFLDLPVQLLLYLVLHHCKCFLPKDTKYYITSGRHNCF